ncbi:MAG: HK97 gp10 family phage protein [Clostridium celatum]|nr:HK97 gp10 family phage protein [Clostridium celatum]
MFIDNSQACKEALKNAQEKWLYAVGELLVSAIRPLIPVYTSNLKTSLDYKVDIDKMEVTIGVGEEYAIYVEFGTGEFAENGQGRKGGWTYTDKVTGETIFTYGQYPQPYMRPGFRDNKNNIKKLLEKYLKEIGYEGIKVSIKRK